MTSKENAIAKILRIIGFILIAGGIIGGIVYNTGEEFGFFDSFAKVSIFLNGVIGGIIFLAFAEVIKLLQGIYNGVSIVSWTQFN